MKIAIAVRRTLAAAAASAVMAQGGLVTAYAQSTPAPAGQTGAVEEIIVTGRQRSAATDVIQERIETEVAIDVLGADQISRVGDSTVSLALRRLPGVTLVNDQFIYVRGLGERYSSTTLNGAYVPSPDLTRNVIPLDLFPSEIIQSLTVSKGYSPDMPAAFGGGNVNIRTTGIPEELVLDFQLGYGWNSESSSRSLTYPGGNDDWQGKDDGTRRLPQALGNAIQTYLGDLSPAGILSGLNRDGTAHTIGEAQAINRQLATALNRDIEFSEGKTDPDYSLGATAGNSWYFGADEKWQFGALALVDYGNQWRDRERTTRQFADPENLYVDTLRTTNAVSLTGSVNVGLAYGEDHRLEATSLLLRNTEDEASISTGHSFNFLARDGRQLRNYRIRFEERELELLQIRGTHTLGDDSLALLGVDFLDWAKDLSVNWYYSDATARTDIPNEVTVSGQDVIDPSSGAVLSTSLQSSNNTAEYRFTDLVDEVDSQGWMLSRPFSFGDFALTLSGGQDMYRKGRRYLQTQFGIGSNNTSALNGTPGTVFTDTNILTPANGFSLSLGGIGTESYLAAETVDAAFGKFDLTWNDQWRIAGGARWEAFKQLTVPIEQNEFSTGTSKIAVPLDQLSNLITDEDDFYPSLSLTYMKDDFWAEDFQLRFGWSQTVARADLREISDATYIDPLTEARVRGNPDLVAADLLNLDVRAEWFFSSGDNFTVSLFYKDIDNPIETVEAAGTDDNISLTFINAESAEVYGVEVEWLKSLEFLGSSWVPWAQWFFVAGNLTVADSEIKIGSQALNVTNDTRRMTQQADYVANLQLGFDSPGGMHSAALVYNAVGERIFFAGRNGVDDAFEQPFHSLDLNYSFYPRDWMTVKFRAQNLLDQSTEIERGGVITLEQNLGITFKLDATLKF